MSPAFQTGGTGLLPPPTVHLLLAPPAGRFPAQAQGPLGGALAPFKRPSTEQSTWTPNLQMKVSSLGSTPTPVTPTPVVSQPFLAIYRHRRQS